MARRQTMSSSGKAGLQGGERTRTVTSGGKAAPAAQPTADSGEKSGCGCGCKDRAARGAAPAAPAAVAPAAKPILLNTPKVNVKRSAGRAASLARREAMSSRGKAGISKNGISAAQAARAGNPNITSRELAMTLREERSRNGGSGRKKSAPCGRVRPKAAVETGAAEDQPWKVGASETSHGQTVTGTMVGRSTSFTGDEPSTCRGVTGTEYLGADIFRDFCQSDPKATPRKVSVTQTSHGNPVSGNKIGRGANVTGNEAGTCKRVTGNEYITAEQSQAYCGEFLTKGPPKVTQKETRKGKVMTGSNVGRSEKVTGDEPGMTRVLTGTQYTEPSDIGSAPAKVGATTTLRGGSVTGTTVGRRERMTGDEAGSCRNVTGDDYVGQEQFDSFCNSAPQPQDSKVGVSATLKGKAVTGTMTGRSGQVTGDEPGSCKAVTGTPYQRAYPPAAQHPRIGHDRPAAGRWRQGDRRPQGRLRTGVRYSVCRCRPVRRCLSRHSCRYRQPGFSAAGGGNVAAVQRGLAVRRRAARAGFHRRNRQPVRAGSYHWSVRHGDRQGHRHRGGTFRQ
jgi:hypothetical protein